MAVIRMEFARSGLQVSGISEGFLNQMQTLRDCRAWGGQADLPRFSESTLRYLEKVLLKRGPDLRDAVFQLAHLVAGAAALSRRGRALDILYGFEGPVRRGPLADYFKAQAGGVPGRVTCEADGLTFGYLDGQGYNVAWARLPLLFALMEFLLTGYDDAEQSAAVLEAISMLETQGNRFDAVRAGSNQIAAALTGQLDAMLRSRAERDRFESLAAFLDRRGDELGIPGEWEIDDDAILEFWLEASGDETRSDDFRQFRTVHRAFVALLKALRDGDDWRALHRPVSMTAGDDETGGIDLPEDAGIAETLDEDAATPLDRLGEDPCGRINFLTGTEAKDLDIAIRLWGAVRTFPLSVLRSEVMGGAQNEIINALRFRRPLGPLVALDQLDDGEEAGRYAAVARRYEELETHLRAMLRACAFVTAERRGIELPEEQVLAARRAFRAIRRAGFAEAFRDAEIGEGFEMAIGPLSDMADTVRGLRAQLPDDPAPRFQADRTVFARAFGALYGKDC